MNSETPLSVEIINAIQQFLDAKKSENKPLFINEIIRDDIFRILESFCTVVYFPQEKEENDGCLVRRIIKGESKDFVYINTYKPIEKQVFTAAHELGHIWDLEKYLSDNCKDYPPEISETAINRFAAILLMPKAVFEKKVKEISSEYFKDDNTISLNELVKFIVTLMSFFFVPFKSVVLRLIEINFLEDDVGNQLIENDIIKRNIDKYIKEAGEPRLGQRNKIKSIKGYPDLIKQVESKELLSKSKIKEIRNKMDIPEISGSGLQNQVKISK